MRTTHFSNGQRRLVPMISISLHAIRGLISRSSGRKGPPAAVSVRRLQRLSAILISAR